MRSRVMCLWNGFGCSEDLEVEGGSLDVDSFATILDESFRRGFLYCSGEAARTA